MPIKIIFRRQNTECLGPLENAPEYQSLGQVAKVARLKCPPPSLPYAPDSVVRSIAPFTQYSFRPPIFPFFAGFHPSSQSTQLVQCGIRISHIYNTCWASFSTYNNCINNPQTHSTRYIRLSTYEVRKAITRWRLGEIYICVCFWEISLQYNARIYTGIIFSINS